MNEHAVIKAGAGDNSTQAYDVEKIRKDFPILNEMVYDKPLAYLDNGASAQKPSQVIEAMTACMEQYYSNVHRGNHRMSQLSTRAYEDARESVARFLNAGDHHEVVFTKGGTEAINLVASSYGRTFLNAGDEIIVTVMEHHANIVPWQMLRAEKGIVIKVVPIDDDGNFLMDEFEKLLSAKTKLVSVPHISNVLGTVLPVAEIIRKSHAAGARVLLDGCQAVPHTKIDVQALGADFYVFSSHKLYGPTGIGVLWAPLDLLNAMPPYQGGGDMIDRVTFEKTTYQDAPHRFEAGTPAIIEAVGFGAAAKYVEQIGLENIHTHEMGLLHYATERLGTIEGLKIIGNADEKASIISFVMDDAHISDIGTIIDRAGVAVRVGHHCAQPLMDRYGIPGTARASFGLYNTKSEIDALHDALLLVKEMFS
ncbi:MAG: cysteine desulfurase [Rhodospirillales bacterium]